MSDMPDPSLSNRKRRVHEGLRAQATCQGRCDGQVLPYGGNSTVTEAFMMKSNRSGIRSLMQALALGGMVAWVAAPAARAESPAGKAGNQMEKKGNTEEKAADAEKAKGKRMEKKGEAMENAGDKNDNKAQEDAGKKM